MIKLKKAPS